jgi:SNF2 family DNA or RNA helicase
LISSNALDFVSEYDNWNVVVLDEGHKIKNASAQVSNACRRICQSPETQRIMLTGTPIQNNLKGKK